MYKQGLTDSLLPKPKCVSTSFFLTSSPGAAREESSLGLQKEVSIAARRRNAHHPVRYQKFKVSLTGVKNIIMFV